VSGLVVLFVLLAGFMAMHGVAATTETGVHHNPVALLAAPDHQSLEPGSMPSMPDADNGARPGQGHDDGAAHNMMVGCLVVLLGALAAVVLRLGKRWRVVDRDPASPLLLRARVTPGGPPPPRRRISLCVIRV